jgi:hypothetical protein
MILSDRFGINLYRCVSNPQDLVAHAPHTARPLRPPKRHLMYLLARLNIRKSGSYLLNSAVVCDILRSSGSDSWLWISRGRILTRNPLLTSASVLCICIGLYVTYRNLLSPSSPEPQTKSPDSDTYPSQIRSKYHRQFHSNEPTP